MIKHGTGEISKLVGLTREAIRQAEKAGRIPKAQRDRRGFRYWLEADLPAIRAAFGIEPPPILMDDLSNVLDSVISSSTLGGLLDILPPDVRRMAEALANGQGIGEAMEQIANATVLQPAS